MKKLVIVLSLIVVYLYGDDVRVVILQGKEKQICKDYAHNMDEQFVAQEESPEGIMKFREFKGPYTKKFTRPQWEPLSISNGNLTLLKRIAAYENMIDRKDKKFDQYNQKFYIDQSLEYRWFYITDYRNDFLGKDQRFMRIFKDGTKPNEAGYSKIFIVFMVVINTRDQSIDIEKTKLLRQAFVNSNFANVKMDLETDTNLFFYNKKMYMDSFYRGALYGAGRFKPKIKIVEIDKNEQKNVCSFEVIDSIRN
ncbi:hypothetical protein [Sulfurimonas sp. HSL3-2]|uniref:hypothetical protein n=1 Tax=Hydrocurvibacter mobilis TaxID=3131936 RepID=UPI0031F9E645